MDGMFTTGKAVEKLENRPHIEEKILKFNGSSTYIYTIQSQSITTKSLNKSNLGKFLLSHLIKVKFE